MLKATLLASAALLTVASTAAAGTWQPVAALPSTFAISVAVNSNDIYAVGFNGTVYVGGAPSFTSWSAFGTPTPGAYYVAANEATGSAAKVWIIDTEGSVKVSNGGAPFAPLLQMWNPNFGGVAVDIAAGENAKAFIVSSSGVIWVGDNATEDWGAMTNPSGVRFAAVSTDSTGAPWAVDTTGVVWSSTNGLTFTKLSDSGGILATAPHSIAAGKPSSSSPISLWGISPERIGANGPVYTFLASKSEWSYANGDAVGVAMDKLNVNNILVVNSSGGIYAHMGSIP